MSAGSSSVKAGSGGSGSKARSLYESLRSPDLPEEDRARIEDHLLADDELFEAVLVAEEELIDTLASSAASGETGGPQNETGIPDLEWRLAFARALHQAAKRHGPLSVQAGGGLDRAVSADDSPRRFGHPSSWLLLPAAAALLVAASVLWFFSPSLTGDREVATYVLAAGETRGASVGEVLLLPETETVELWLELPADARPARFSAELIGSGSRLLSKDENLRAESRDWGRFVAFGVAASLLEAGRYRIVLHTVADDDSVLRTDGYEFEVVSGGGE